MIGNEQGYHIRTSNFYSNEVHDKGDPSSQATLGNFGQLWTSDVIPLSLSKIHRF